MGDKVVSINLAAGASGTGAFDPRGPLNCPKGVYVELVSGTIEGSVDIDT